MIKADTVNEYVHKCPEAVRPMVEQLRATIHNAVPGLTEDMSYGMPTFSLDKRLLYFAVYTKHISLYPLPSAVSHFLHELDHYKTSKGTIQFPLNEPLPLDLITRIAKFRASELKQAQ